MSNPQDSGEIAVSDTSLSARDEKLTKPFQYGRIENMSFSSIQKWRSPDSGVGTYQPSSQMVFYLETGGAAFLNTQEIFLTFTFTPILSAAGTNNTSRCMLDFNTDALFSETQLQINGTLCEHLLHLNLYSNVISTLENKNEQLVTVELSNADASRAVVLNTPTYLYTEPTYQSALIDTDVSWFGGNQNFPRQGAILSAANYSMAYHLKSFVIGKWAKQYFPLAFVNQLMYTMILESATTALKDASYTLATGVIVNDATWSYSISNVRLNYTLTMVQDEVAASIQKAYLSNALPDLMHSGMTYTWQQSTTLALGATNPTVQFTLSGSAFEKLIFIIQRDGDTTRQYSASLSNFVGGFLYAQCKVNGQTLPQSRLETDLHPYNMFRLLGFAYGQEQYCNNNIPLSSTFTAIAATGNVGAAAVYTPTICIDVDTVSTTSHWINFQ